MNSILNDVAGEFCIFMFNNRDIQLSDESSLGIEYIKTLSSNRFYSFTLEFKDKRISAEVEYLRFDDVFTIECFDITDGDRTPIDLNSKMREFFGINAINPFKPTKSARINFN